MVWLFAVLTLVLMLAFISAVVATIEWRWLETPITLPRSILCGILLVSVADWGSPAWVGGVLFLIGLGLVLRPWLRRRFGLTPETKTITVAHSAFRDSDIGSGLHLKDGERWEIIEVLNPTQVVVQKPRKGITRWVAE